MRLRRSARGTHSRAHGQERKAEAPVSGDRGRHRRPSHLKERIETLKTERDITQASLDRIAIQAETRATITRDRLEAFSKLMREKLDTGDTRARKAYLQSVISQIEVDDDKVRIIGDKPTLAAVIAGRQNQTTQVRSFVRKWRARRDSNS